MAGRGDAAAAGSGFPSGMAAIEAVGDAGTRRGSRLTAAIYDPFLLAAERAGMRRRRRELLRHARGRVVEIGAGTGLNAPLYPDHVGELILTEPTLAMSRRLRARVRRGGVAAEVLCAPAERLPLADGSVDTVVSTLVLCTVEEPARVLAEIRRVLRPGGRFLFLEHVRADSPRLARWQDRLEGPWRRFAAGCRCNRPLLEQIRAAGFAPEHLSRGPWRAMPPIVRPLVIGRAQAPG
jgi:SAM-dependent methyltransferase